MRKEPFCHKQAAQFSLLIYTVRLWAFITKTRRFKYIENFTTKNENVQMKNSSSFHIFDPNIDCEYLVQPPPGGSNEYPQSIFFEQK